MSLIRGNALAVPLADESVDLIVTSPPYFALRSYTDGGKHYDGQIGSEPTPADFIAALLDVTRECVRVLKPSGSLWVNLGDKYASGGRNTYDTDAKNGGRGGARPDDGARPKSLLGLPWRYALGCIDDLGLILRAEVIWSKPNGLPESVQDRVRRSHEQWFHFTKEPRYFSAVDEIREPHLLPGDERWKRQANGSYDGAMSGHINAPLNPLGKLPGSVWTIDSQLWLDGPIAFCPRCGRDLRAGPGPDGRTTRATAITGSRATGSDGSTGSPTGSGSAPSPTDTPSTTPVTTTPTAQADSGALTDSASTLLTSKRSPSASTSSAATLPAGATPGRPSASTGTPSANPTPTSGVTAVASAACVCETGLAATGQPSVWVVPTEPLRVPDHLPQHFAAFPSEWPKRIILGWSPSGVCVECGEGRRPVADVDRTPWEGDPRDQRKRTSVNGGERRWKDASRTITGESCACPTPDAPTRPAIILDPFAGTGTTVAVANALGRYGVGLDLSADYLKLARWRCQDPGLRAKVLGVDKPKPEVTGQLDLLGAAS